MLNNLRWETLSVESLNDSESSSKRDFVEAHIGALHNVVRRIPTARAAFRHCHAVDVVQKFRAITEHPVIIFSYHEYLLLVAECHVNLPYTFTLFGLVTEEYKFENR